MNIGVRVSIMLLLFVAIVISLTGCGMPEPMSQPEADAFKACLEKSSYADFDIQSNGRRILVCGKKK